MYQNGDIGKGATLGIATAIGTNVALGTEGIWLSLTSECTLGEAERPAGVMGLNIIWASDWP